MNGARTPRSSPWRRRPPPGRTKAAREPSTHRDIGTKGTGTATWISCARRPAGSSKRLVSEGTVREADLTSGTRLGTRLPTGLGRKASCAIEEALAQALIDRGRRAPVELSVRTERRQRILALTTGRPSLLNS